MRSTISFISYSIVFETVLGVFVLLLSEKNDYCGQRCKEALQVVEISSARDTKVTFRV